MPDLTVAFSPNKVKEFAGLFAKPEVIQAVNELLIQHHGSSTHGTIIKINDVIKRATKLIYGEDSGDAMTQAFDRKWLNIEGVFRQQGWVVTYHAPSWDENFEPYFEFKEA